MPGKSYDDRVLDWLRRKNFEVVPLRTGDTIPAPPGVEIRVLSPPAEMPATSETNPGSVVLRVAYRGRAMILTADAPPEQLAAMAARPAEIACDVVLLPHHGQQSAEILDFLKRSQASAAVMSVGRYRAVHQRAKFDWPADLRLYRTYLDGAVTVRLGEPDARIETFVALQDSKQGQLFSGNWSILPW